MLFIDFSIKYPITYLLHSFFLNNKIQLFDKSVFRSSNDIYIYMFMFFLNKINKIAILANKNIMLIDYFIHVIRIIVIHVLVVFCYIIIYIQGSF